MEIALGECFGLLGPNPAGKTTTVEILEGLTEPTAVGEIVELFASDGGERGVVREVRLLADGSLDARWSSSARSPVSGYRPDRVRDMVRREGQRNRAVHHLDVRGLLCPLPVRLAARELEGLPVGAELEIVGDDPVMRLDMPAFCDREGHRLLALDVAAGRVVVRLRKGGDAHVPSVTSVERGGQSTR